MSEVKEEAEEAEAEEEAPVRSSGAVGCMVRGHLSLASASPSSPRFTSPPSVRSPRKPPSAGRTMSERATANQAGLTTRPRAPLTFSTSPW